MAANRNADIVAAVYRELRQRGTESELLALLDSPDPGVRGCAGAHALEFAPIDGQRVLTALASDEFRTDQLLCGDHARRVARRPTALPITVERPIVPGGCRSAAAEGGGAALRTLDRGAERVDRRELLLDTGDDPALLVELQGALSE